jgi:hypothetical protein
MAVVAHVRLPGLSKEDYDRGAPGVCPLQRPVKALTLHRAGTACRKLAGIPRS